MTPRRDPPLRFELFVAISSAALGGSYSLARQCVGRRCGAPAEPDAPAGRTSACHLSSPS
jgi:hypothetical protein